MKRVFNGEGDRIICLHNKISNEYGVALSAEIFTACITCRYTMDYFSACFGIPALALATISRR